MKEEEIDGKLAALDATKYPKIANDFKVNRFGILWIVFLFFILGVKQLATVLFSKHFKITTSFKVIIIYIK